MAFSRKEGVSARTALCNSMLLHGFEAAMTSQMHYAAINLQRSNCACLITAATAETSVDKKVSYYALHHSLHIMPPDYCRHRTMILAL
jgi:hypothetical protein